MMGMQCVLWQDKIASKSCAKGMCLGAYVMEPDPHVGRKEGLYTCPVLQECTIVYVIFTQWLDVQPLPVGLYTNLCNTLEGLSYRSHAGKKYNGKISCQQYIIVAVLYPRGKTGQAQASPKTLCSM